MLAFNRKRRENAGTFESGNVLVRTDILTVNQRSGGYSLIEVKSSTGVRPHYIYDVSLQRYVLDRAGVPLKAVSVMHLNSGYVLDGEKYDLSRLFVISRLKPDDLISDREISKRLNEQFRILNQPEPPNIKPGRHCEHPYRCEFYDHCNPELPQDHISFIPRLAAKKIQRLEDAGVSSMKHVPSDFPLTRKQWDAVQCVVRGAASIAPSFSEELAELNYPLCFMDFETIFPALPRFQGMAPYDHIPFQWSSTGRSARAANSGTWSIWPANAATPVPRLRGC